LASAVALLVVGWIPSKWSKRERLVQLRHKTIWRPMSPPLKTLKLMRLWIQKMTLIMRKWPYAQQDVLIPGCQIYVMYLSLSYVLLTFRDQTRRNTSDNNHSEMNKIRQLTLKFVEIHTSTVTCILKQKVELHTSTVTCILKQKVELYTSTWHAYWIRK
jgi:hypothetical protein